jgi:hypothetical protein
MMESARVEMGSMNESGGDQKTTRMSKQKRIDPLVRPAAFCSGFAGGVYIGKVCFSVQGIIS